MTQQDSDKHDKNVERVKKAVRYIENNLNRTLTLNEVADACCLSPYYFHRLFRRVVGETLNDHIHRKKMERATKALICRPELSITEVAMAAGFSSPANFSKAFKAYFDVSPKELRNPEILSSGQTGKLYQKYGTLLDLQKFHPQTLTAQKVFNTSELTAILDRITIQPLPARHIIYCSEYGRYHPDMMSKAWDRILDWAATHGIDADKSKRFRLFDGNPIVRPEPQCRFDAAIEIDEPIEVSPPCYQTTLASGLFAIAPYEGPHEHSIHFCKEVYYGWLPDHGYNSVGVMMTDFGDYCAEKNTIRVTHFFRLEKMTPV